jgi:hypothetical protein
MLAARHPSVKQGRVVGLFGAFDICKNEVCGCFRPRFQTDILNFSASALFAM